MDGRFFVFFLLATLWFLGRPSTASVYPTKPTRTTMYEAGLPAHVVWIDDGKEPLLNRTGNMKIDLYEGNTTYLATLAKDVDPMAMSTTLFIPPSVMPKNYRTFTLHFISVQPDHIFYTADFGIMPSSYSSLSSSSLPSTSSKQVVTVTSTVTVSRAVSTPTAPSTASQKGSAGIGLGWALGGRSAPKGRFTFDVEKMKFRMMFIAWPALVGLSMSL